MSDRREIALDDGTTIDPHQMARDLRMVDRVLLHLGEYISIFDDDDTELSEAWKLLPWEARARISVEVNNALFTSLTTEVSRYGELIAAAKEENDGHHTDPRDDR